MTFSLYARRILRSARERGIVSRSTPKEQLIKAIDQLEDFVKNLDAEDPRRMDRLGDVVGTLIVVCDMLDFDAVSCLQFAYEGMKERGEILSELIPEEE